MSNSKGEKIRTKKLVTGKKRLKNLMIKLLVYGLICIFGFVFIYPILYATLKSFMPPEDVFNPMISLIPSKFSLENYHLIFSKINFFGALISSLYLSSISAILQSLSCGLTGYGLSRFDFKLKKFFLALIVVSFVIPTQVLMIPTYLGYSEVGIIGSPLAFFIPAVLGQGLKSSIFILIFYSFFNTLPKALDEAAAIDGASPMRIFFTVAIPLSVPAIVLTFIFSMVWYWNENYLTGLYLGEAQQTLPNQMALVLSTLENAAKENPEMTQVNVPVKMAAVVITISPLLLFYGALQRQFVESIDKTGITGE